jgi:toxin ParE1/3/4
VRRGLCVRPRADRDIDEAADHYFSEAGIAVATRFHEAVEQAWNALCEQPKLGVTQEWLSSRLRGCRKWHLPKPFQVYQVFYCVTEEVIDIVRVLHGSRDMEAVFDESDD